MTERNIRLIHPNGTKEVATIINFTPLRLGTRGGKLFLTLQREHSQELSHMVQRKVEYTEPFRGVRTSAQHYMYLWESLCNAGLTVVNEVVALSDNKIAETNVTADGSMLLGKGTTVSELKQNEKNLLTQIDLENVRKEALRQAQLASEQNILLSADHCFDLLVRPTGDWQVIARDIKNTFTNLDYKPISENTERAMRFVDFHIGNLFKQTGVLTSFNQ